MSIFLHLYAFFIGGGETSYCWEEPLFKQLYKQVFTTVLF